MADTKKVLPFHRGIQGGQEGTGYTGREVTQRRGGSGGGSSVDAETKNYLDAKVDAVRAQNDARFAEVRADISALSSKIDAQPTPVGLWQLIGVVAGGVVALVGIIGVMADRFDGGVSASAIVDAIRSEQSVVDADQNERLDRILDALETQSAKPEGSPEGQD